MEEALRPGRYISEHASFSVVNELESVAARIAEADPERAVGLYETFIAACYEKADEVDDSSGYLGMFGGSLSARWVTARQAVSADPADTVARLLRWMARDQYGFWSHVEDDIASALDEAGRAACAGHLKRPLGSAGMISRSRRTRRAGVPASGIMVECPMMNCWNVSASSALADGRRRRSPAPSRCRPRP